MMRTLLLVCLLLGVVQSLPMNMDKQTTGANNAASTTTIATTAARTTGQTVSSTAAVNNRKQTQSRQQEKKSTANESIHQQASVKQTLGTLSTVEKLNSLFFKPPFPPAVNTDLAAKTKKNELTITTPGDSMQGKPACKLADVKKAFSLMLNEYQRTLCQSSLGMENTKTYPQAGTKSDFKQQELIKNYMSDYTYPFSPSNSRQATLEKHILNHQFPRCQCLSDIPTISYEAQKVLDCERKKDDPVDKFLQEWNVCNGRTYTGYEVPQINPLIHPFQEWDATTYSKQAVVGPTARETAAVIGQGA